MFNTPILFLIFNRPDTTKQVFAKIREIQPKQLFIAADGARTNKEGEEKLCELTRKTVTDNIDWDCEIKTLFREENLGCGKAVSSAITWFFDHVEQGIILEDDTLPDLSFFPFCEELLNKYKEVDKIKSIGGTNFFSSNYRYESSYFFSEYGSVWGWASWRRSWKGYDYDILSWQTNQAKKKLQEKYSKQHYVFFEQIFNSVQQIDTWDYQWWYHRLINDGLDIIPSVNLIKNIGFDLNATHTLDINDERKDMSTEAIQFPLKEVLSIRQDNKYDLAIFEKYFLKQNSNPQNILKKILNYIRHKR